MIRRRRALPAAGAEDARRPALQCASMGKTSSGTLAGASVNHTVVDHPQDMDLACEVCSPPAPARSIPRWRVLLGYATVYFSLFCFALVLVIPFFPFPAAVKATMWTVTLVTAEIGFWVGVAIAGPDLLARLRRAAAAVRSFFVRRPGETASHFNPATSPERGQSQQG